MDEGGSGRKFVRSDRVRRFVGRQSSRRKVYTDISLSTSCLDNGSPLAATTAAAGAGEKEGKVVLWVSGACGTPYADVQRLLKRTRGSATARSIDRSIPHRATVVQIVLFVHAYICFGNPDFFFTDQIHISEKEIIYGM